MPDLSPHAVIEPGATLAPDVRVGAFSRIGPNVRLAAGCVVDDNVVIAGRTMLGEKTHVFPMASIGAADGADGGDGGRCEIGQACAIREHVTIHAGRDEATRIGNDNLIMIACEVGGGAVLGDHGIFANCTRIADSARVEDYVRTSAFAAVERGATVGAYTFIAGYAVIDREAPPYAIVQGAPFRVRGVNVENLKRCGFGDRDIRSLREAFRAMFDTEDGREDEAAVRRFLAEDPDGHVGRVVRAVLRAREGGAA